MNRKIHLLTFLWAKKFNRRYKENNDHQQQKQKKQKKITVECSTPFLQVFSKISV